MILIENLHIRNYKNIKEISLTSFKDLNIIIGPNNCGKTSILESINCLEKIEGSTGTLTACEDNLCSKIQNEYNQSQYSELGFKIHSISCIMQENDQYLRKHRITIEYLFSSTIINDKLTDAHNLNYDQFFSSITDAIKDAPNIDQKDKSKMIKHLSDRNEDKPLDSYNPRYTLIIKQFETTATRAPIPDISMFNVPAIFEFIRDNVCFIEDNRLQNYKNKNLLDYLRDKNLSGLQFNALIHFLQRVVDSNIETYKQNSLDLVKTDGFITSISEQGSGVRSLICLATDILSAKSGSIILIDEPELGLNPYAKQEFLKFLNKESKRNQIFITTHDPTFVNPILWKSDSTTVYLYSLINESFIKVSLDENNNDPATFAGYLPHTTSLKSLHLYVEGASDVYIFQTFIRKYLIQYFDDWSEQLNNIGIYHMSGNNWMHMLSTIPKYPFKSIILLDGDKKKQIDKINNTHQNFNFCETLNELQSALRNLNDDDKTYPLYCLKNSNIESYLDSDLKSGITNYKKKIHGPKIAEKMENIPEELEEIFDILFK
jgi:predicted ATP-dependent endonuclease of OLD family